MTQLGVYMHWKGDLYRVIMIVKNSTNDRQNVSENVVVYVSLKTGRVNAREEDEFHEWNEERNGPRFEYIGETSGTHS